MFCEVIFDFIKAFIGVKNIVLKMLIKFDCDDRTNIYIGVTGILVAIVIFIVEIITNKRHEVLYIVTQTIIDGSIIYFMYKTLRLFTIVIKLNTNETYMNEELDSYIQEEIFLFKKIKREIRFCDAIENRNLKIKEQIKEFEEQNNKQQEKVKNKKKRGGTRDRTGVEMYQLLY